MSIHVPLPWPEEGDAFDEVDAIEAKAQPTPDDLARLDMLTRHPSSLVAMSARVTAGSIRDRGDAAQAAASPAQLVGTAASEHSHSPKAICSVVSDQGQPTADAEFDSGLTEPYTPVPVAKSEAPIPVDFAGGDGRVAPESDEEFAAGKKGGRPTPKELPKVTTQPITILASDVAKYVMELRAMVDGKFVSYLRVSTARQGASGLGLEAQRKAVGDFLAGGRWTHVREFVEIESGKRDDRPKLADAMALCRLHGAVLVIAKLDRLSRDAHFLLGLQKAGVRFVAADMPEANEMVVGIMAVVAQAERKMISTRTKAALAAAKARGTKLGGDRGNFAAIADRGRAAGRAARHQRATARAADVRPIIAELQAEGVTSLAQLAAALTERGIPTSRGADRWSPMQVSRVMKTVANGT